MITEPVVSQGSGWDVERVLLGSVSWFVQGVSHDAGIRARVLLPVASDFAIMPVLIGLGTLSLTGLCANCHGYVVLRFILAKISLALT